MRRGDIDEPDLEVLEFLANPTADLEAIRRRHREIAAVEEGVKIRPQKKSVRDGMRAARGVL
jgi:hypothetical protein